jgi:hypothetical protein
VRAIHASPVRAAEKKIADLLPWLVDKMVELVEGVEVQETDRRGQIKVYTTPPDRQAAEYLMDRVMGKATQPIAIEEQVDEIAADFGVEPARVTSIIERLKAKRTG